MEIKFTNHVPIIKRNLIKNIMRVFLFLFCTTIFALTPNTSVSQNAKIKINADMEVTIDEVFNLIENQTDYSFVFPSDVFENASKVNLNKGTIRAYKLLDKCLSNTVFMYDFTADKTILLKRRPAFIGTDLVELPQQTVSGTVTDKDGAPMPGVNVLVGTKGSSKMRGIATDFDGKYSIDVVTGEVIRFSYVGYITQEFTIANQSVINVTLLEDTNELEEVIISTGYQKISKERVTGSFLKISETELEDKITQSVMSKLEGQVAGLVFDNENGPTIRGISTINAINDPLIVVDGFPITQGIESINPNDIQDITVLKDAAAASIWGIRAANGVIVIVTKKGTKNKKPSFEFSTNFSMTPHNDIMDYPYASTNGLIEWEKHKGLNDWIVLPQGNSQPPMSATQEAYLKVAAGLLTMAEADAIADAYRGIDSRKEFENLFMDNSTWTQYNFAISGGGERNTYRSSIAYNKNENTGSFVGNDREEIMANIRNVLNITDKLTFTGDISFNSIYNKSNGVGMNGFNDLLQHQNILDANGDYVIQDHGLNQDFKEQMVAEGFPYNWDYNLKQEHENMNNKAETAMVRLQTALKYDVTDYLALEGLYQYEYSNSESTNFYNENTYYVRNTVNTYTAYDENGVLVSAVPKGSIISKRNNYNKSHSARIQLNFDESFDDGLHTVNAIGGYEVRQVMTHGNYNMNYGFDPQSLTFGNVPYGEYLNVTPGWSPRAINDPASYWDDEDRYISYYGNAAYTYNSKYTVTGSIRLDDANMFGASDDYRNKPLYSFGTKWNVAKEDFIDNDIFNTLALRVTYGSNGNVDTSTSPYLQATIQTDYQTSNLYGFISNVKNPSLRLEKTYVTNIGVDYGFLDNKLRGSIEYYKRRSEDLLSNVSFSSTYGFNTALINAGEMTNKGIDFNLQAAVVSSKDFKYNTTFNFSYNKNEVTKVDVPEQTINTYIWGEPLQGKPLHYLYSFNYAGLDENGDPGAYNENGELINVKGQKLIDGVWTDGYQITNTEALIYEGTTTPKYYGSWINNFNYKNFYLKALTTFKLGHVFRNTDILEYGRVSSYGVTHIHEDFEDRWQNPGDEAFTDVPRIPDDNQSVWDYGYHYYKNGHQLVDSASHIRFKELIIGYNFDNKLLSKVGLDRLSLSFQARNLGVITFNKWDIDPESIVVPIKPTYSLNFTANF